MDASQDGPPLAAPVIDRMFTEAMTLLEAARALARSRVGPGAAGARGQVEALRITARLAAALAWMLAAKAVNAGEISAEDMARDYGLDRHTRSICLQEAVPDDPELPAALRALTAASLRLYSRLARLDELIARRSPR